jgi:putative GTP pyrophosphokinase
MTGDSAEAIPDRGELRASYDEGRQGYARIMSEMERRIRVVLEAAGMRPTIKGRIKSFDSWYGKRIRLLRQARQSGSPPIPINDVVALRAVCPFLGDLNKAERALCAAFTVVDVERKGSEHSFREFGYESIHLLIELPEDLRPFALHLDQPRIEVQLRTILQEAWAEVEHEIVYKSEFTPFDEPMKRKLAALNANLSLSDIIFQEILDYQRRLNAELERRRANFYGKIESAMDRPLAAEDTPAPGSDILFSLDAGTKGPSAAATLGAPGIVVQAILPERFSDTNLDIGESASLDDLLLAGLMAHNREDYERAGKVYSDILAREPQREIAAIVHKHRGMAYFSQSRYDEAIEDFSSSSIHPATRQPTTAESCGACFRTTNRRSKISTSPSVSIPTISIRAIAAAWPGGIWATMSRLLPIARPLSSSSPRTRRCCVLRLCPSKSSKCRETLRPERMK